MRSHPGRHRVEPRRARWLLGELDGAAAADAAAERTQAIDGCLAVPGEPAALAPGGRLRLLAQLDFNVPSRWSSAFAVFCNRRKPLRLPKTISSFRPNMF